eukprot:Blabericola_migrator_1__3756@NODE_2126_length_3233_cov_52_023057_g1348_i0_p1_GENE_NODE_2126_length_3233_cov_52_023057_g1348_i0NODE_2126_length_3233_cov_52_023057_g1348_i0_p1_ORF_typecomplete_len486_score128_67Caudo_TAP/PF02413_17/0_52Caudo_TAP/PF02413_17/6e03Caudo_TAP/PF02413_17/7_5e02_NODE_2126_length_3233_cov_52_023057_g1348_i017643221
MEMRKLPLPKKAEATLSKNAAKPKASLSPMPSPTNMPLSNIDDALRLANETTNEALAGVRDGVPKAEASARIALMRQAVSHAQKQIEMHRAASEVIPKLQRWETYSDVLKSIHDRYPAVRRALTSLPPPPPEREGTALAPPTKAVKAKSKAAAAKAAAKGASKIGPKAPPRKDGAAAGKAPAEEPPKKTYKKFLPERKDDAKRKRLAAKKKAFAGFGAILGREKGSKSIDPGAQSAEPKEGEDAVNPEDNDGEKPVEEKGPLVDREDTVKLKKEGTAKPLANDSSSSSSSSSEESYYAVADLQHEILPAGFVPPRLPPRPPKKSRKKKPPEVAVIAPDTHKTKRFVLDPTILMSQSLLTEEQKITLREWLNGLPGNKTLRIILEPKEFQDDNDESELVEMEMEEGVFDNQLTLNVSGKLWDLSHRVVQSPPMLDFESYGVGDGWDEDGFQLDTASEPIDLAALLGHPRRRRAAKLRHCIQSCQRC